MRSLLTGMLMSMITVFAAMWFLSSNILKQIHGSGTSSLTRNAQKTQNTQYRSANVQNTDSNSFERSDSQWNGPYRSRASGSPFGPKLSLKSTSNPFAPKLSLRGRTSPEWGRERRPETPPQSQVRETDSRKKASYGNTSASDIISGFKDYVDLLNELSRGSK